jgi:hypothetical protein
LFGSACTPSKQRVANGEGVDVSSYSAPLREDYSLFAQRCSKCHALSRALANGDRDDAFWQNYVRRMRRQPGSGISPEDEVAILRFLHAYTESLRAERGGSK